MVGPVGQGVRVVFAGAIDDFAPRPIGSAKVDANHRRLANAAMMTILLKNKKLPRFFRGSSWFVLNSTSGWWWKGEFETHQVALIVASNEVYAEPSIRPFDQLIVPDAGATILAADGFRPFTPVKGRDRGNGPFRFLHARS